MSSILLRALRKEFKSLSISWPEIGMRVDKGKTF